MSKIKGIQTPENIEKNIWPKFKEIGTKKIKLAKVVAKGKKKS